MGTKRRRIAPRRIDQRVPIWAQHLLATGEAPREADPDFDRYFGWRFCGETVPGLPDPDSMEGAKLCRQSDVG